MTPVKYTFDKQFDSEPLARHKAEKESVQDASAAARLEAHTAGIEEGRTQAFDEIENATALALANIATSAEALFNERVTSENKLREEATQLAFAVATKLAPALMKAHPLAEIETLIGDCLALCHKEARIVVRVHEDLVGPLSERLEGLSLANSFPGDVVLLADTALARTDCRVEWPDGGAERKLSDIMAEIESAVQRFVVSDEKGSITSTVSPRS